MTGKHLSTKDTTSAVRINDWRSYDMGCSYRMSDVAANVPAVNNPFPSGTPENVLWASGWTDADGGDIDPMSAYIGQTAPA